MTAKSIYGDHDFGGTGTVVDLRAPEQPGDAATKAYVDARLDGIGTGVGTVIAGPPGPPGPPGRPGDPGAPGTNATFPDTFDGGFF